MLLKRRRGVSAAGDGVPACRRPHSFTESRLIDAFSPRFPHIEKVYGPDCVDIFAIIAGDGKTGSYLRLDPPLLKAEVIHAVRDEMAVTLADVVLRRTDCGTCGCPARHDLQAIASVMAGELAWDDRRIAREIDEVAAYFSRVLGIRGKADRDA